MYSQIRTSMLDGICAMPVQVEVDISMGMPVFDMVGYLSPEVREAKERVRTALHNCGILLPAKRITVNLSPANIRKTGTGFDLPIAVALLVAMGLVKPEKCADTIFSGELNLSGQLLPVRGILPMVSDGVKEGIHKFVVPADNLMESRLVQGADVCGFSALESVIGYLQDGGYKEPAYAGRRQNRSHGMPDFSEVNGQQFLKRAAEIAASGMHNMLMVGPPGAGKTMIAQRIPGILPPLTREEQLEVMSIYSIAGKPLTKMRPFQAPHHTISPQALAGGGRIPKPGVLSLAHRGILFLDEMPEFSANVLEVLRQPLEEKKVQIARTQGVYRYPAEFMLVCALNPCPCGYFPDRNRCRCTEPEIRHYLGKISGPILDRIDICVEAAPVTIKDLEAPASGYDTKTLRVMVEEAREMQKKRYRETAYDFNGEVSGNDVKKFCRLGEKEQRFLEQAYEAGQMSVRSYHKIIKLARTIADLEHADEISVAHLAEAICYHSGKRLFERRNE